MSIAKQFLNFFNHLAVHQSVRNIHLHQLGILAIHFIFYNEGINHLDSVFFTEIAHNFELTHIIGGKNQFHFLHYRVGKNRFYAIHRIIRIKGIDIKRLIHFILYTINSH